MCLQPGGGRAPQRQPKPTRPASRHRKVCGAVCAYKDQPPLSEGPKLVPTATKIDQPSERKLEKKRKKKQRLNRTKAITVNLLTTQANNPRNAFVYSRRGLRRVGAQKHRQAASPRIDGGEKIQPVDYTDCGFVPVVRDGEGRDSAYRIQRSPPERLVNGLGCTLYCRLHEILPRARYLVRTLRREAPGEVEQIVPLVFVALVPLNVTCRVHFLRWNNNNLEPSRDGLCPPKSRSTSNERKGKGAKRGG